jgi:MFS family permease
MADTTKEKEEKGATWFTLPQQRQLAIVLYARFTEPLAQTSFTSYMYYQLASFENSPSDKEIAIQAGLLSAVFALGSCVTAIFWGRLAQSPAVGPKNVVFTGLIIACISCFGIGFATHFYQILVFQMIAWHRLW